MTSAKGQFSAYWVDLPLRRPFVSGRGSLEQRRVFLLRLEDERGHVGWGEAAPLPGFSQESPAEVEALLRRGMRGVDTDSWPPSLLFALESAQTMLYAAGERRPMSDVHCGAGPGQISINALVSDAPEAWPQRIAELVRSGQRCIKIKVGREDPGEEGKALTLAVANCADKVSLRLDANQAWTPGQALRFAEFAPRACIEYLEEPFPVAADWQPFYEQTQISLALDESLRDSLADSAWQDAPGIVAVVIKPTLHGAFTSIKKRIASAAEAGRKVVFSGCFESGVGTWALASLAAAFGSPGCAHGFDTYAWIKEDLLTPRLDISPAKPFETNRIFSDHFTLDENLLTPIIETSPPSCP